MDAEPQRAPEKEGRRLRALRACFHRALRLALDCPMWEVRTSWHAGAYSWAALITLCPQDFAVHFKDLPEHYTMALFDLYQQVDTTNIAQTPWCQDAASFANKAVVRSTGAALDQS